MSGAHQDGARRPEPVAVEHPGDRERRRDRANLGQHKPAMAGGQRPRSYGESIGFLRRAAGPASFATVARRALSLVLLVALVLGLTGQAPVMAQAPQAASGASAQVMDADCAAMMAGHEQPAKEPCDGTLHCMLAMGCLSATPVGEPDSSATPPRPETPQEYWPAVSVLTGTNFGPEPDPPTLFG
jgi:hypothetical protein